VHAGERGSVVGPSAQCDRWQVITVVSVGPRQPDLAASLKCVASLRKTHRVGPAPERSRVTQTSGRQVHGVVAGKPVDVESCKADSRRIGDSAGRNGGVRAERRIRAALNDPFLGGCPSGGIGALKGLEIGALFVPGAETKLVQ